MHDCGSYGTNVLWTGIACFLCWAGIGPDINKIATEIRIALILRLLQPHYGITALVRPLIKQSQKRPRSASAGCTGGTTLTRMQVPHHRLALTRPALTLSGRRGETAHECYCRTRYTLVLLLYCPLLRRWRECQQTRKSLSNVRSEDPDEAF